MSTPPTIEIIPPAGPPEFAPPASGRPSKKTRALLFAALFTLGLAASQAYVWLRAPLYESTASLLTTAPEEARAAGDATLYRAGTLAQGPAPAANGAESGDGEHTALQRQILLGMPVLEETLKRLREDAGKAGVQPPALADLRKQLSVMVVPETNLVELKAQGPKPGILAPLVNAWIDAYQALREQTVTAAAANNYTALEEQSRQLERKVQEKREALERFRSAHDILAKADVDNTPMVRLRGLNEALTKAMDEQAKAKGKLEAVRAALAQGKPVVPPGEAAGLENLEKRAQELREMQKDLKRRFTPAYLAMNPQLKQIPEQLAQVEEAIRGKAESGSRAMLGQAEQDFASAQQAVADLREKIADMKRESTEFSNRFAEQEAMRADLERLEAMRRETLAKLAQTESQPKAPYPPLQVVERAYPPTGPAWPDYWRDSGVALAGSLVFALACVWLHDFLTKIDQNAEPSPAPAMPTFQFYSVQGGLPPRHDGGGDPALLPGRRAEAEPLALESPFPRELTGHEIHILLDAADAGTRQWIALILSGLSAGEVAAWRADDVDFNQNLIRVGGRSVPLAPRLKAALAQTPPVQEADAEEVEARIHCAAHDSGLPEPAGINAAALRHSYLAHLVRQGIRLSELERVAGRLPAKLLASYGQLSPPGPGLPAERVALVHPALAGEG